MDLVTGGTGIVGAHVLLELLRSGRQVRALCRTSADSNVVKRVFQHYKAEGLLAEVAWVDGDLLDVTALSDAMKDIEHVYHAAALVSFDPRQAETLHRVNMEGTANLVNAALEAGVTRLCHVSSTAAIGWAPPGVARHEALPWKDDARTSDYARSKYEAELQVQRGIAEGLDAVIVNPCVVLGPGAPGRSSMTLVERLQRGSRSYPPGSNAFVDARDVAACMVALIERGTSGERYLIVGENATYEKLFKAFAVAFGNATPKFELEPWMLGIAWRLERLRTMVTGGSPLITRATASSSLTTRSYSNEKVTSLLGYRFRSLEESVANVSAFAKGTVV